MLVVAVTLAGDGAELSGLFSGINEVLLRKPTDEVDQEPDLRA